MITNQSVQKIDDGGHVQGDELDGQDDPKEEGQEFAGTAGSSQRGFGNNLGGADGQEFPSQVASHQGMAHNDAYGQPIDILPQDQEDLDAIIESISYGKTQQVKKLQFQAFTAAIAHED